MAGRMVYVKAVRQAGVVSCYESVNKNGLLYVVNRRMCTVASRRSAGGTETGVFD